MQKENVRMKITARNTQIQSLKIKGLLPRPVVIKNLLLKDATFYIVDRKKA